jgi:cation diffusion facilitator CzcD-associated flavoprotein CzcO
VSAQPHKVDVLVVGAGFTGIYMAHKALELGFSVMGIERGDGVGGTWYWNRYPGLRCDVESIDYSYSFNDEIAQEWTWTEKFPAQPDILKYLEFVADKLRVKPLFTFGTEVTDATWDEEKSLWHVATNSGLTVDATFLVWGTGILSTPKIPEIPGMDEFEGELLNTAVWPKEAVNFAGKRVAVMGTGSSGIQVIPIAAETAEHLYVLQRTPSYSLPAHNRPLAPGRMDEVKAHYASYRANARSSALGCVTESINKSFSELTAEDALAELERTYNYGSPMRFASTFTDIPAEIESNNFASSFVKKKIRERVGNDELADKLIPDYYITTRRLCIDTNYYETFRRDNVTLVDMREEKLLRLTKSGFQTEKNSYDVDMLILATGFDAITGTLRRINITGRNGATLRDKWNMAPSAYMGITVAGFPNMFVATGPASPAPLSNVVVTIEVSVEWIAEMLNYLREKGICNFDATAEAEQSWVDHTNSITDQTLMRFSDSWYTGSNVAGKPRVQMVYLGGVAGYEAALHEVAAENYRGFTLTS